MASEKDLTKEDFLQMAKAAGLDTSSPHMEELYPFVRATLRSLASLDSLDLTDVEPEMVYSPEPGFVSP